MSELSKLYPDLIIGDAFKDEIHPNTSVKQQNTFNNFTSLGTSLNGGELDHKMSFGDGIINTKMNLNKLKIMWEDHFNSLLMQGGKDNWSINYERKF